MIGNTAHRIRILGALSAMAVGALSLSVLAGGCGGKTNDQAPADDTDTGIVDSGTVAPDTTPADTAKPDTTPPKPDTSDLDTEPTYDAPGSLFDVDIPDVVFEGGKTAAACYACTEKNCHDELAACDKDVRCRGLSLCVLIDCKGSTTDLGCLAGCASSYDVTSFSDPVAAKALAIANCTRSKCAGDCPSVPLPGDGGTDSATTDSTSTDTGSTPDAAVRDASPAATPPHKAPPMSIDPQLIEALQSFCAAFEGDPEAKRAVVEGLSH